MSPAGELDLHMSPPILSSYSHPNDTTAAALPLSPPPPPPQPCDAHTCPWWPYSNSKDFKTNTALILIILFCALLCALAVNAAIRYILRQHRQQARNFQQDEEAANRKPSVAQAEVEMEVVVPTLIFSSGEAKFSECSICLSEFVEGDAIRVLESCDHGFHLQCIEKWLIYHSSCPTCRATCLPQPPV